ncbi:hypothetical protein SCALM49S_07417 [Streptomyces californicus]
MTGTFTTPGPIHSVTTSRRSTARWLTVGGVLAGPLFLAAGLAQGLTRDGFDSLETRSANSLWVGPAGFRR